MILTLLTGSGSPEGVGRIDEEHTDETAGTRPGVWRDGLGAGGSGYAARRRRFLLLVQQVAMFIRLLRQDSGADQDLKRSQALGQTSLHAAAAKQRGCGLQCPTEACPFLNTGLLRNALALRSSFPPAAESRRLDLRHRLMLVG